MISEREIWTTAGLLIKEHGERAAIIAAQKADAFLASGDMDGRRLWIRIMKATASMIEIPQGVAN